MKITPLKAKFLSALALLGGAYFFAVVVVLHFLRTDLNPLAIPLSAYHPNEKSLVLVAGFVIAGLAEIVLALLITRAFPKVKIVGRMGLCIAGAGLVLLGLQRTGNPHLLGALMQITAFPVAVLFISSAIQDSNVRQFSRGVGIVTLLFAPLVVLARGASSALHPWLGLVQKFDVAMMLVWSGIMMWKIYRLHLH